MSVSRRSFVGGLAAALGYLGVHPDVDVLAQGLPRPPGTPRAPRAGMDDYDALVADPARFRAWLDQSFRDYPELFPRAFAGGYRLKDARASAKLGLLLRRVRRKATGEAFSVRPSFARPYMAGWTDDAQAPLFLRAFGVPFRAVARVFGQGPT